MQCHQHVTHPNAAANNAEPAYTTPTYTLPSTDHTVEKAGPANGATAAADLGRRRLATMGDGTHLFLFGLLTPDTQRRDRVPNEFNVPFRARRRCAR